MKTTMVSIAGGTFERVAGQIREMHSSYCDFSGFDYVMHTEKLNKERPRKNSESYWI